MPTIVEDLNRTPGETEDRALRELLRRDIATRLHLEQQILHCNGEILRAKLYADAFQECLTSTEEVQVDLKAAVGIIEKLLVTTQSALHVHHRHSEIAETISSTLRARGTFGTIISSLNDALLNMTSSLTPLESHVHTTSDESHAYKAIEASAAQSLSSMKSGLKAITTSILEKKRVLHPIRRLPAEILERIFTEFVEDDRRRLRYDLDGHTNEMKETLHFAPFIISSVCRRWRRIAVETPWLWNYLRVPTRQTVHTPRWLVTKPRRLGAKLLGKCLYELSLERSKDEDLEVTLYPSDLFQSNILQQYLATIPPSRIWIVNVHRFRTIPDLPCNPSIMRVKPPKYIAGIQPTPGNTTIHTKSIVHLECWNTFPSSGDHSVGRTIRRLDLLLTKKITWPDPMSVFIDFPNLSHLSFYGLAPNCPSISSVQPLVYDALVFLILFEGFTSTLEYLLNCGITFPALKQLVIEGISQLKGTHYYGMRGILDGVQDVTIKPFPQSETPISSRARTSNAREALDLMHNIQTLRIHNQIVDTLIGSLNIKPLKVINHLVIEDWVGNGDQVREYIEKVKARADSGSIGVKVSFVNCPNVPTDLSSEDQGE